MDYIKILGEESKYSNIYFKIIENSKQQNRSKKSKQHADYIYYELHHILPRSIYPEYEKLKENPWNGVLLTAKEHFICHILLSRHFKNIKNIKCERKMSMAIKRMKGNNEYTSRIYQLLKLNLSHSEETKRKIGLKGLNRKWSSESKKIVADRVSNSKWINGKRIDIENINENDDIEFKRNCDWMKDTVSVNIIGTDISQRISKEEYRQNKQLYTSAGGEKENNSGGNAIKGTTVVFLPDGTKKRVTVKEKVEFGYTSIYKNNSRVVILIYDEYDNIIFKKERDESINKFCLRIDGLYANDLKKSYTQNVFIECKINNDIFKWKAIKID